MIRSWGPWLVAVSVLLGDRLTKLWLVEALPHGARRPLLPGLTLTHVHNRGIAFSLFSDGGAGTQVVLTAVVLLTIAVITWLLLRHPRGPVVQTLALGAILGGAAGNLIDRLAFGWVIDFVELWVRVGGVRYSWPDFNVADASITTGAVLLVITEILRSRRTNEGHGRDASHPD